MRICDMQITEINSLYLRERNQSNITLFSSFCPFYFASALWQKAPLSVAMSLCPPTRVYQWERHWAGLRQVWYWELLRETVRKYTFLLNKKNMGHFTVLTATSNMLCLQKSVQGTHSTCVCFISERSSKTPWSFVSLFLADRNFELIVLILTAVQFT